MQLVNAASAILLLITFAQFCKQMSRKKFHQQRKAWPSALSDWYTK